MSGSHPHTHAATITSQKMWWLTFFTFAFCLIELIAGYLSNSLALMSDAGHNFADGLALALSAYAVWIAKKPSDHKRTFGYHRVGILAALINAIGLVFMAGVIFWEAILRLRSPEPVASSTMIWMAMLAVIVNSVIGWLLHEFSQKDLNIRSAYIHMLGDAAASVGVVIAGIIIAMTGAYIADPIVSIIFAILVLWSSWDILNESIHILLEATPAHINLVDVETTICEVSGVLNVHDLHVWTISSGLIACSCHIQVAEQSVSKGQEILHRVADALEHEFKISHSTIQIEVTDCGGHEHGVHHHDIHQHAEHQ